MADVRVQLDDAMGTSLIMLYGLARDARTTPTILGDTVAAAAFDRVDYDFARLKLPRTIGIAVATRARHFDEWTRAFLAGHDEATVLNLGAGLDSRVWRVAPGPGVAWYDVDHPAVVDIRRAIFPERAGYRMIGASVTDPDWLAGIPSGRPALIIAQGLTMYLHPDEGRALFRRLTAHFPSGAVILDTHSDYAVRRQNKLVGRLFGATMHWAINGPAELEAAVPGLRLAGSVSGLVLQGDTPGLPVAEKVLVKTIQRIPKARDAGLYLRFTFGA